MCVRFAGSSSKEEEEGQDIIPEESLSATMKRSRGVLGLNVRPNRLLVAKNRLSSACHSAASEWMLRQQFGSWRACIVASLFIGRILQKGRKRNDWMESRFLAS